MGFLDKLKNVFFEEVEEEFEEEDKPVKLAKKVELPKRNVDRVVEKRDPIKEQEIPSQRVTLHEEKFDNNNVQEFTNKKYNEVNDIVNNINNSNNFDSFNEVNTINNSVSNSKLPMMFEEEDFLDDSYTPPVKEEVKLETREERPMKRELYQGKKETSYVESVTKAPAYTYTKSYYESKETKGFKPSPIISPIYGVLDKNYRKEEVVTKREVKVTSSNYQKIDLDSVRNKAFGEAENKMEALREEKAKEERVKEEKEERKTSRVFYQEEKKIENEKVDVESNNPKDKITLADADEYYNDLGLAYNVDYNVNSSGHASTRAKRYRDEENSEETKDDNLFDLIDLMYNKED